MKGPMMKIFFAFLFLAAFFVVKMPAQQVPFPDRSKVRVETRPRGDNSLKQKPTEGAEGLKVLTDGLLNDTYFTLFVKEYSGGKEIVNEFDLILADRYTKGNKIILEIIPDIVNDKHLRLFTYYPGGESFRQKISSENTRFKYALFEKSKKNEYDKRIPILLIYEEKELDSSIENLIKENQKDEFLPDNLNMDKNIYPHLNRYFIVYYVLTEIKN
ncbi:hypothetical protein [Proteiniphilum acetatigenes]|uniref:hypothetical protein n=1 Tax=Proteiniphilum acetatigenes TaxID=294710 RepID=UPI0003697CD3|nr:hypothetical protein [Proteiniphilum acetatigenes]SFK46859.1 hypothetical protein SAMN05216357_102280 [Porphyromonadaceae bacterium KH3CP3RA]